ncbi:ATP-binding protein [Candidatus Magnetominusculus dajiuhuensis]|uniref:DNA polymerase III subunit n=1 Tax=Candidatus Magnetominusculus dajiuhuensis TaxID=3137712 RepID=UPI003B43423A
MPLNGLMGQPRAIRILGGMLMTGRIVPAYLFTGAPGTGKKTAAFSFIKAMNCEDGGSVREGNFCGRCRSCKNTDLLVHPDLKVMAPEDTVKKTGKTGNADKADNPDNAGQPKEASRVIQIDQIREAVDFLSTSAMEWKGKAIIIKDAHAMNVYAGNAFLKTLEEPPAGSIIVLITNKEDAVLDTIRSRCVKIPFVPLSFEVLRAIADKNGASPTDEQLGLSNGSASAMLNDTLISGRNRALLMFTEMVNGNKTHQWKDRQEMALWFEATMSFLRDMAVLKLGQGGTALVNMDKKAEFANLCKAVDIEVIVDCYETLFSLSRYFAVNINKGIVFNYTALKLRDVFGRVTPSQRGRSSASQGAFREGVY